VSGPRSASVVRTTPHIDFLAQALGLPFHQLHVESSELKVCSHEETVQQFNTNFFGAINLTRAVLPHFRARKSGKVIFMSSISGWLGAAAGGPYSATKFALEGKQLSPKFLGRVSRY
jgi:NAD(P)-dependent dehydrogenase (short-subunit alcohol dehydrogenase family)